MIPIVTPRMNDVIQQLSREEAAQMEAAILANNDLCVLKMLAAKDQMILYELMHYIKTLKSETTELDPDADWVMPKMYLRKHIWENFPVNVVLIDCTEDGRERYAVQWHNKKFQEARDACEHGWQYMDFEDDVYRRLMKSLYSSHNWTVESATRSEDICVIVMNVPSSSNASENAVKMSVDMPESDDESVASAASAASNWENVSSTKTPFKRFGAPVLRRLNDIKQHFPVIWNEVHGCSSTTYAVEIFGKKAKEQGLNVQKVTVDLLQALKASRSWTVLPATSDRHVCLLQMNHLNNL